MPARLEEEHERLDALLSGNRILVRRIVARELCEGGHALRLRRADARVEQGEERRDPARLCDGGLHDRIVARHLRERGRRLHLRVDVQDVEQPEQRRDAARLVNLHLDFAVAPREVAERARGRRLRLALLEQLQQQRDRAKPGDGLLRVAAESGGVRRGLCRGRLRDDRAVFKDGHQRRDRARFDDARLMRDVALERRERGSRLLLHPGASRPEKSDERLHAARIYDGDLMLLRRRWRGCGLAGDGGERTRRVALRV